MVHSEGRTPQTKNKLTTDILSVNTRPKSNSVFTEKRSQLIKHGSGDVGKIKEDIHIWHQRAFSNIQRLPPYPIPTSYYHIFKISHLEKGCKNGSFLTGVSKRSWQAEIIQDHLEEAEEMFEVLLVSPEGTVIGSINKAQVTIRESRSAGGVRGKINPYSVYFEILTDTLQGCITTYYLFYCLAMTTHQRKTFYIEYGLKNYLTVCSAQLIFAEEH